MAHRTPHAVYKSFHSRKLRESSTANSTMSSSSSNALGSPLQRPPHESTSEPENDLDDDENMVGSSSFPASSEWKEEPGQTIRRRFASLNGRLLGSSSVEHADNTNKNAPTESKCHVCNAALRLYRFRHHCRNCGQTVCGVHSKNHVPLPHLGIMKEVRVCDICIRQLVQRRAGYRSPPHKSQSSVEGRLSSIEDGPPSPSSPGAVSEPPATETGRSSMSKELELMRGPMTGILYSSLVEQQDNTMDDILYLGSLTMAGRSAASRRMGGSVAIWKDRMFLLTAAEILCFKASRQEGDASLGELRSSVHLTDILHIEVNDALPRILTVVRSDGRIFRVRAKTSEECSDIAAHLKRAMQQFQDAMHRLHRGPLPEDNWISCVTVQHESSLPESVLRRGLQSQETLQVDLYPSSILRFYVNAPNANGVASFSCESLLVHDVTEAEAEPVDLEACDSQTRLHVSLHSDLVPLSASADHTPRRSGAFIVLLVAVAVGLNTLDMVPYYVEVGVWLGALILLLLRVYEPLRLLVSTRRLQLVKRLNVTCDSIEVGQTTDESPTQELLADEELDERFLEGCNGDVDEAKRRYKQTLEWRKENDMDNVFFRPFLPFTDMKESYLHCFHKRDKHGHPVMYEFLGNWAGARENFLARGVSEDQAVMHTIMMQEFMWQVLDPRPFPNGTQLKIYDIRGISMGDVSGDIFNYTKKLGETVALYNPERLCQVFIINPPAWFSLIWKMISPLINPNTRERVHVLRGQKEIAKGLLEVVPAENLPEELGGECECSGGCLGNGPEERDLKEYMALLNEQETDEADIEKAYQDLCAKYRAQLDELKDNSNE